MRSPSCLIPVALLLSLALPTALAVAEGTSPEVVKIDADHQTYDANARKFSLSGNVQVFYQDFFIKSSTADLDVDVAGQPEVANFYNRPHVKRTIDNVVDNIHGDVVRIYLKSNTFGAEGNVDSYIATVAADPFTIKADTQTFDNTTKMVTADGNVKVHYKDADVSSAKALLRMTGDGKAERVIFSGSANIKQEDSRIRGDKITVMVDSGNLIAESNVNTQVDLDPPKDGADKVLIKSDYQQYDKASDKMLATGHVWIKFGGYIATGSKATFKLKGGDLDHILLTGRPTITEKDRTITADKITITTNPQHFDAVGNVKIRFKTNADDPGAVTESPAKQPATTPKGSAPKTTKPSDDLLEY